MPSQSQCSCSYLQQLHLSATMTFFLRPLSLSQVTSSFKRLRCYDFLPPSFCLSAFSSVDVHACGKSSCRSNEQPGTEPITIGLNECKILDELSDLLPIRHGSSSICTPYIPSLAQSKEKSLTHVNHDGFLSLEDKLRGVFLQKLNGKTAVEKALTDAISETNLTLDVVMKVVDRGNLGGEAMVTFFNWAVKHPNILFDASAYHVILKALGRRKFFKLMVQKLQHMCSQGISPTSETLLIVFDSFLRAHQVSCAIDIYRRLKEFGLKHDTCFFNVLLKCMCLRSYVGSANSLLNSMKGTVEFDIMTYNLIIGGWSRLGRVDKMEVTLEAMINSGFNPDSLTYSCLIEGFGKAGRIDDAVRIFQGMSDYDCLPDTSIYNAMISGHICTRNFGECMKYYELMLSNGCLPNADTYTKLIGAFLKARKVADALELFDGMLDREIVLNTGTVTSFIETLCCYGPPHAAMLIYKGARKSGCRISLRAYKLLLARLSRFGKCGMLLTLWREMQESGFSSDAEVYEYIINGLCNNGQLDNAVLVMEESLQKGFCPSRVIYGKLNNKLMAAKKVQEAYKLFLKIKVARGNENARKYCRANGWHF